MKTLWRITRTTLRFCFFFLSVFLILSLLGSQAVPSRLGVIWIVFVTSIALYIGYRSARKEWLSVNGMTDAKMRSRKPNSDVRQTDDVPRADSDGTESSK